MAKKFIRITHRPSGTKLAEGPVATVLKVKRFQQSLVANID